MKQTIKFIAGTAIFFLTFFLFPNVSHASVSYASAKLQALDTVAGFETLLTAQGFSQGAKVNFEVTKPNGVVSTMFGIADREGKVELTLSAGETTQAGIYAVKLPASGESTEFQVFPGDFSPSASGIFTNRSSVAANGVESALLTVRIVDEFGNPLPYHEVSVTSNRAEDRMRNQASQSNEQGIASFLITSEKTGTATLTAVDESTGTVIDKRATLTFTPSFGVSKAIGGDPETLLLAQAGQPVSKFGLENIPATFTANASPISFTVTALESNGNVSTSYAGTVVFSSTDPNAQLPSSYSFKPADQGRHTFSLSLSFKTVGTQKLTVQEQGNPLVKGEKTVEVVTGQGGGAGQVKITKPATGTYSVNKLEVAGEASPNAKVKLFDNGQQIAEVQANSSGRFSYLTSLLTDGQHTFHAESNSVQSTPVVVTIDSTPAQVEQVEIAKKILAPGETTEITVRTDPDVSSIQATVADFITDLKPDENQPGMYRGTLTAPQQNGEYTVNVIITDKVGNPSPTTEVGKIKVDSSLKQTGDTTASFAVPSTVTGVKATAGNAEVLLEWESAKAAAGIAFYRIYYSTDQKNISQVLNTKDVKTSFVVSNVQNGKQYFFQVVGVDTEGNEGDNRSEIVSATPSVEAGVFNASVFGAHAAGTEGTGSPVLCDPSPCETAGTAPATPQDGPEIIGMVISALFVSSGIRYFRRKK